MTASCTCFTLLQDHCVFLYNKCTPKFFGKKQAEARATKQAELAGSLRTILAPRECYRHDACYCMCEC